MSISLEGQIKRRAGDSFHTIADKISSNWGFQRVVIEKDTVTGVVTCRTQNNIFEIIRDVVFWIFSFWAPQWWKDENRSSIEYFYEVLGSKNIALIDKQWDIGFEHRYNKGLDLCRRDIEKLFVGMGDVDMTRAEELFSHIIQEKPSASDQPTEQLTPIEELKKRTEMGILDRLARRNLQRVFRGKEFKDLTKADWDQLWKCLVPFNSPNDMTLGDGSSHSFWARYFSGSFTKVKNRVYLQERLRRARPRDREMLWELWVGKAVLGKESQRMGTVVPHPAGYHRVSHELESEGASVLLLDAITETSEAFRSCIKFQPTRTNPFRNDTWLSWRDDLGREVGRYGANAVNSTLRYLFGQDVRPDNLDEVLIAGDPLEQIGSEGRPWVLGYSLGGAQAQIFTYMNPDLEVSRLRTICAPKIKESRCKRFVRMRAHDYPINIRHYIEIDDPTPGVGQGSLGLGCHSHRRPVQLVVFSEDAGMTRNEVRGEILDPPTQSEKFYGKFCDFFKGFVAAHPRNSTLDWYACHRFSYANDDDHDVMDRALGHARHEKSLRLPVRRALKYVQGNLFAVNNAAMRQLRIAVA